MISFVRIMLNASIPLFHQHLVFIVYESPLGLVFVSLSIKIAFVNLKKASKCFFISSGLLIGHTSLFRIVVVKSFCSFLKSSHSIIGLSFDPEFCTGMMVCHLS